MQVQNIRVGFLYPNILLHFWNFKEEFIQILQSYMSV